MEATIILVRGIKQIIYFDKYVSQIYNNNYHF